MKDEIHDYLCGRLSIESLVTSVPPVDLVRGLAEVTHELLSANAQLRVQLFELNLTRVAQKLGDFNPPLSDEDYAKRLEWQMEAGVRSKPKYIVAVRDAIASVLYRTLPLPETTDEEVLAEIRAFASSESPTKGLEKTKPTAGKTRGSRRAKALRKT